MLLFEDVNCEVLGAGRPVPVPAVRRCKAVRV